MVYQYSYHSHPPIHPSIHPPTHPSSTHASAHLSMYPSTHPSSIHSSAHPSTHPSVYKPIYPIQQVASSTFLMQALFKDKILHDPALPHLISYHVLLPSGQCQSTLLGILKQTKLTPAPKALVLKFFLTECSFLHGSFVHFVQAFAQMPTEVLLSPPAVILALSFLDSSLMIT